jgi:predicted nucleotidyltransferase
MRKSDAIALLLSHADELRAEGVAHVALVGSVARDEGGPASDIDIVVEGPPERPITLFGLARAEAVLEAIFGRKVDLTARQGLDNAPDFRRRIASELIPVF